MSQSIKELKKDNETYDELVEFMMNKYKEDDLVEFAYGNIYDSVKSLLDSKENNHSFKSQLYLYTALCEAFFSAGMIANGIVNDTILLSSIAGGVFAGISGYYFYKYNKEKRESLESEIETKRTALEILISALESMNDEEYPFSVSDPNDIDKIRAFLHTNKVFELSEKDYIDKSEENELI